MGGGGAEGGEASPLAPPPHTIATLSHEACASYAPCVFLIFLIVAPTPPSTFQEMSHSHPTISANKNGKNLGVENQGIGPNIY